MNEINEIQISEMDQIIVKVPKTRKKAFQRYCLDKGTNMTIVINGQIADLVKIE